MDLTTFQPLFDWLHSHPGWAGLFVFLIAFSESLLIVGLIVPGTVVMFGIGTMVGTGVLGIWATLLWAFLGAVAGDGISYALGYYFRDRIANWWPFNKKPQLLEKGRAFFQRHGGKSILFGRFVGPVRPVIPAIAGMMQMSPTRFFAVNVLSALLWAPAYLLPGILVGTSVGLASEVATHLGILVFALIIVVMLVVWLMRRIMRWLSHHTQQIEQHLLIWANKHPKIAHWIVTLSDPSAPEGRVLLSSAIVLIIAVGLLATITGYWITVGHPSSFDYAVSRDFLVIRSSVSDAIAAFFYQLASPLAMFLLSAGMLTGLWLQRNQLAIAHWLAVFAFGLLALWILNFAVDIARPDMAQAAEFGGLFPSWHGLLPVLVWGFSAVLISGALPQAWRWLPYTAAVLIIMVSAITPVYFGVNWVSDVLAGWALGITWLLLVAYGFRRHVIDSIKLSKLLPPLAVSFLVASVVGFNQLDGTVTRFAVKQPEPQQLSHWQATDWLELPARRVDGLGILKQPLTLQWQGELSDITNSLVEQGWQVPTPLNGKTALSWFSSKADFSSLPILPKLHNGRPEQLILTKPITENAAQWVLRLWPSGYQHNGHTIWLGYVTQQQVRHPLGLIWVPVESGRVDQNIALFRKQLSGWQVQQVERHISGAQSSWLGATLLIAEKK